MDCYNRQVLQTNVFAYTSFVLFCLSVGSVPSCDQEIVLHYLIIIKFKIMLYKMVAVFIMTSIESFQWNRKNGANDSLLLMTSSHFYGKP